MKLGLVLLLACLLGLCLGWLLARHNLLINLAKSELDKDVLGKDLIKREERIIKLEKDIWEFNRQIVELKQNEAKLETKLEEERKSYTEKLGIINEAEEQLVATFKALSAEALQSNNQSFLELAKGSLEKYQAGAKHDLDIRTNTIDQLVAPLKESLVQVDIKINELEKARISAYSSLQEQLKAMSNQQLLLQSETSNLVKALRTPEVRGRWGEIQLKRVAEIAGMLEYCDFYLQASVTTDDGKLRPDMLVKLPNNRNIVVDAKVPLAAYLDAIEAEDDLIKEAKLKEHAKQLKTHINQLAAKNYWNQFQPSPEFVVLFLPGEAIFSTALQYDASLIEYSAEKQVILATPTTLIALLKAVAYGWRNENLAQNAEDIRELGSTLYYRLLTLTKYINEMGKGLNRTIKSYNDFIGSYEGRVIVTARKFKELGVVSGNEIPIVNKVDTITRELLPLADDEIEE